MKTKKIIGLLLEDLPNNDEVIEKTEKETYPPVPEMKKLKNFAEFVEDSKEFFSSLSDDAYYKFDQMTIRDPELVEMITDLQEKIERYVGDEWVEALNAQLKAASYITDDKYYLQVMFK